MSKSRSAAKVAQNAPNRQNSASAIFAQKHSDISNNNLPKQIKRSTKHAKIMSGLSIISIEHNQKRKRSKSSTERSQPTKFDTCNF